MGTSKHTPGPWRVTRDTFGDFTVQPHSGELAIAAVVNGAFNHITGHADEHTANARLITAAPEMYDALKAAEQFIRNGVELGFIRLPDAMTPDPAHHTLPRIQAALANAEGRS